VSENFRPGDKIRITHEITVDRPGETCDQAAYAREGGLYMWNRDHSTVELIEAADDPSKDPIGTVRDLYGVAFAHVGGAGDAMHAAYPWVHVVGGGSNDHRTMKGSTVVGAVPNTPAWDAWQKGELASHLGRVQVLADSSSAGDPSGAPEFPGKAEPRARYFRSRRVSKTMKRIDPDGRTQRSYDGGVTWSSSTYSAEDIERHATFVEVSEP